MFILQLSSAQKMESLLFKKERETSDSAINQHNEIFLIITSGSTGIIRMTNENDNRVGGRNVSV